MYLLLTPNKMASHNISVIDQKTQKRFRLLLMVFRASGLPLLFNKVPKFFNVYAAAATICCYTTIVSIIADLFVNTENLERTMETSRTLFPGVMIVWMHAFIR
jgi:hypothetical protein